MVTIYDVAKKAGVSPATVSRVLNNRGNVTPETEQKVNTACAELNFVPNSNASSLRKKNTKTLALIVPDIQNPFFTSVLKGFEGKTLEKGYNTIVCDTDESSRKEGDYIDMILSKRIDGVAVSTVSQSSESLKKIVDRDIPFVLLDRRIEDLDVDLVCGDSYRGAIELTEHLVKLDHEKIAIITAPIHLSTSKERLEGYKRALSRHNLEVHPEYVMVDKKSEGYSRERAYEFTLNLLEMAHKPTAIFAANNLMALGVYKALTENGFRVPDDFSIVCFDDLNLIYEINPFFTVMRQPSYTMGNIAAELLLNKIEGNRELNRQQIVLQPELVIRKSSRKKEE